MSQKVLRYTQNATAAKAEVELLSGRILHKFCPVAFVAELPDSVDLLALKESTSIPTQPLDDVTKLAVSAWIARSNAQIHQAPSPNEGLPWDTPGRQGPKSCLKEIPPEIGIVQDAVEESTGTPTSLYLVGSVAIGLVIVSRNTGIEKLSEKEKTKIVQEVQEGLDWLARVEPRARVSFSYDIRPITVTALPGPYPGIADPYEKYESGWRDAALHSMGYEAGRKGYRQYANDLRNSLNTDWAYVAFFTKYELNHFAYAIYEKVVMHYENDGWGEDDINRVFAHESCHIFGASDEYGECECGASGGFLAAPNNNCVNCFPPGNQTPCLMNRNSLVICNFSRRQIGWDPALFPPSPPEI